uniref:Uncharacterized protein n=1 Tax=Moniliophthora roreri TaxID=221103 RepID=A0A0W0G346_MONRR
MAFFTCSGILISTVNETALAILYADYEPVDLSK